MKYKTQDAMVKRINAKVDGGTSLKAILLLEAETPQNNIVSKIATVAIIFLSLNMVYSPLVLRSYQFNYTVGLPYCKYYYLSPNIPPAHNVVNNNIYFRRDIMLQSILIAIAISIDSFSVGVAYGIKDIKVPLRSVLILDFISIALLSCGFFVGNFISGFLPSYMTSVLGSLIIFFMGIWYLTQGWLNYKYPCQEVQESTSIATISIKSLGIAINILRSPLGADLDTSGEIDVKEAILLGFALAIDSLAVGVAVSISSLYVIFITLTLVAFMNLIFLYSGMHLGNKFLSTNLGSKTTLIPGIILIGLGLFRLF